MNDDGIDLEDIPEVLQAAIQHVGGEIGPILAEYSKHGSCIAYGITKASDRHRSYMLVLVTNDMAKIMAEWLEHHLPERKEAMSEAGIGFRYCNRKERLNETQRDE